MAQDPEKREPVFGQDHAQEKYQVGMVMKFNRVTL
jgi:hypothetical protein